ncbi:unnamed protein product [Brassica rapa]|uniref:Pectinesterase n=2 Tax=Brassica TaxID=3705 RepID=A0A8D9CUS9_BRACM|nr:unnamed protein product [Brassica napus]CAG7861548.1 unnamed protein product [Brassica rapa]
MAENNEGTKLFGELDWVLWKCEHNQPKDFNIDIVKTVVVGQSGATDFKTIQEAIDSVPSGNNNWIKIQLQNGIYF